MPSFALIAEGLTDQIILERMIEQLCEPGSAEEVFVNPLQPVRDATDEKTAPHGGWGLVLEYCERSIEDALVANDYVVIHIDTDCGDDEGFGINLTENGADRPFRDIVSDARDILINKIGGVLYQEHANRFVFAISVHSIESWLLIYMFDVDEPKNSLDRINRRLGRKNKPPLLKERRPYERVAREIKYKRLIKLGAEEHSLAMFVAQLTALPGLPVA